MATVESNIIDTLAGYYGFTLDNSSDKSLIDNNGQVNRCFVVLTYPIQPNDVDINISSGENDWAIKTGDGSIIPCFDPVPLYINRDNTVIQFTMKEYYPANSPCSLVYHSSTASFSIAQRTTSRDFEENYATGHIGYTIEGYKGDIITVPDFQGNDGAEAGLVNKVMISIPFPHQISTVKATISDGDDHWAIRMGDNEIIPLKDPEVIAVNTDNFVVLFKMHDGYSYPSNSPGILLYKNKDASINITTIDDDKNFYPVSTLFDLPKKMISGQKIDLSVVKVEPYNASRQYIDWAIVSGPGEIVDKHYLYASKAGDIKVRATIENALEGDDSTNDFVQSFIVKASQNVITIDVQPVRETETIVDYANDEINVIANSLTNLVSYQWYMSENKDLSNSKIIKDATNANYVIPKSLAKGDYYCFCRIMSDGATHVDSNPCHIHSKIRLTGIKITPNISKASIGETYQMKIEPIPKNAEVPKIIWESTDSDKAFITQNGELSINLLTGAFNITAKTLDGSLSDILNINISEYIPVTNISLDNSKFELYKDISLKGNIIPEDATYKNIVWSIAEDKDNIASISNNVFTSTKTGTVKLCASVERGATYNTPFKKELYVEIIDSSFIPVSGIYLDESIDINQTFNIDNIITLKCSKTPVNSSKNVITFSVISGPGIIQSTNMLSFNGQGNVVVRATIKNGLSTNKDFYSDFVFKCSGTKTEKDLNDDFIAVTDANIYFEHTKDGGVIDKDEFFNPFGENENPSTINVSILPILATNKDTTFEIKKIISNEKPEYVVNGVADEPTEEYWTSDEWVNEDLSLVTLTENNKKISCNISHLKVSRYYQITIHLVIKNGKGTNVNFEKDVIVKISTENTQPFIPLKDIDIMLPSKIRTYYPILVSYFSFNPSNATIIFDDTRSDNTFFIPSIPETEHECAVLIFDPKTYDLYHTILPLDIFEWNRDYLYLYPYNPGKIYLRTVINSATVADLNNYDKYYPEKTYFEKTFEYDVLPPFIPVKNIENIPSEIASGSTFILSPEVSTGNGLDCYNPCWDEEEATNKEIEWSLIDGDTNKITISNDGVIVIDELARPEVFKIKATIHEGTSEYLEWYGKTQDPEDYEQTFEINVVAANSTNKFVVNIATLTLNNGATVNVTSMDEMSLLSNDKGADYSITIDNRTFQKSEITSVKFWDSYMTKNLLAITNDAAYISSKATQIDKKVGKIAINTDYLIPQDTDKIKYTVDYEWSIVGGSVTGVSYDKNNEPGLALNIDPNTAITDRTIEVMCNITTTKTEQQDPIESENPDVPIEIPNPIVTTTSRQYYAKFILINVPELTSLRGFGWNFTGLTSIDRIPDSVTGDDCLRDFLRGCTSFNRLVTIPSGVTGDRCLMYFLRDCTRFNSTIKIPTGIRGTHILHGLLYGCTSFNREITIPSDITGESSMERFLYGCTMFNQEITIPAGLSGKACLRQFLGRCTSFNKPLTLPNDVGEIKDSNGYNIGRQMNCMLECADSMCSTITVPEKTGINAEISERTFSSYDYNSDCVQKGITILGPGTENFLKKLNNSYEKDENGNKGYPPYVHIVNLD